MRKIKLKNNKQKMYFIGILLLLSLSGVLGVAPNLNQEDNPSNVDLSQMERTQVERVVDGDTIVVAEKRKVRLILINAPESVHPDKKRNSEYGKRASAYLKDLLEGKTVYLERDVSDTDRYGRLLRYVYLPDGTLINEKIVMDGYANLSTYPPDVKYVHIIQAAEQFARENNLGLWKK